MAPKIQPQSLCTLTILTLLSTPSSLGTTTTTTHNAAAPALGVDCSSLVLNMADCLSFVSNGSTIEKPEKACCLGLKMVLKTGPQCLCEAFKNSDQFGVALNVTKALTLPVACNVKAPPANNCGLSLTTPAAAPGGLSPSLAGGVAPTSGLNQQAPIPSPGSSGSQGLYTTVLSLIIGFIIASFTIS